MPHKDAKTVRNTYIGDPRLTEISSFGSLLSRLGRRVGANPENNLTKENVEIIEAYGSIFQKMSYNTISTSITAPQKLEEQLNAVDRIGKLMLWKPEGRDETLYQLMYIAADKEEKENLVTYLHDMNEIFGFEIPFYDLYTTDKRYFKEVR